MKDVEFSHIPVMPDEVIDYLNPHPGEIFIDGTLGGGGHSKLIANKLDGKGRVICIDQDSEAISAAKINLSQYLPLITFVNDNFSNLDTILSDLKIEKVNGILLDLGVSSYQLENPKRGFSFSESESNINSDLDMRMNPDDSFSAYDVINGYREDQLVKIFYEYGEEPYSRSIAGKIIHSRQIKPITTTNDLLEIIRSSTPPKYRFGRTQGHYASKIFRAIRMEVNQEFDVLTNFLRVSTNHLAKNGHLVIISFHSIEDRLVKHTFRNLCQTEPENFKLLTKKPLIPSDKETLSNPKSRSAKVRVLEKL